MNLKGTAVKDKSSEVNPSGVVHLLQQYTVMFKQQLAVVAALGQVASSSSQNVKIKSYC